MERPSRYADVPAELLVAAIRDDVTRLEPDQLVVLAAWMTERVPGAYPMPTHRPARIFAR